MDAIPVRPRGLGPRLSSVTSLKALDVHNNKFGDQGLCALERLTLKKGLPFIIMLDVSSIAHESGFELAGMKHLADMLARCPQLTALDLSAKGIRFVQDLAEALQGFKGGLIWNAYLLYPLMAFATSKI